MRLAVSAGLIRWKKYRIDTGRKLGFQLRRATGQVARPGLVNFVIAGAQKCGTTALDSYLREHAELIMPEKKELHFFDVNRHFRGKPDYRLYHAYFPWKTDRACYGEATPHYMFAEQALKRMRDYNPAMKLIIVLRNPVDRAFSHWNMERDRGYEDRDFMIAIEAELESIRNGQFSASSGTSYLKRGFYARQLKTLLNYFPDGQIHIIRYEELRRDPLTQVNEVCEFLGVAPLVDVRQREVHARSYDRRLSDSERQLLAEVFEADIRSLEEALSWDCSDWLSRPEARA